MSESQKSSFILQWTNSETGENQHSRVTPPILLGRHADNTIVLTGKQVSRQHAEIIIEDGQPMLIDRGSKNGTLLNGAFCGKAPIWPGDTFQIGQYTFTLESEDASTELDLEVPTASTETLEQVSEQDRVPFQAPKNKIEFPPPFFREAQIPLRDLGRDKKRWPVEKTTYLAIGGGLGSFAWVNHLRIYGANEDDIAIIGGVKSGTPYEHYQKLCEYSQIPAYERLRSNSDSCPDNIWGWPGYAVREMWDDIKQGHFQHAAKIGWQIFGEPTVAETYTPRSGDVFRSLDQEAARIGWYKMFRFGRVRAIRQTDDGRYVVAYSQTADHGHPVHKLMVAQYLHLAVGYPAIRLVSDLKNYRERYRDFVTAVNAYEDHNHVYRHLHQHGGIVLLRGRGIVASRIIQRLNEVRTKSNKKIVILHLLRTARPTGQRSGWAQRVTKSHWEFQPFNWPKACWGGDLKVSLEKANRKEREALLECWGGTTTADRQDWQAIIQEGLDHGWYQIRFGHVEQVERTEGGKVLTIICEGDGTEEHLSEICTEDKSRRRTHLVADFVIDATGLEAKMEQNPLLNDLINRYQLERNIKDRLQVTPEFEITDMRNGKGRMYASGIITLGSHYAPVDSFLGLQYAAQQSVDALTRLGAPGLRYLNGLRSVVEWVKWANGKKLKGVSK